MTGLEALQSVQFVTIGDKRLAILDAEEWDALVDWIETIEDISIARAAYAQLEAAGGDRARAGWHRWEDVRDQLD